MKNKSLLLTLLAPVFLISCTQDNQLQMVVNQQGQMIRQLQSQISNVQPAQANSWSQMQQIQQELAQLRGDLDNLNHATSHLGGTAELGNTIAKHDRALRLIESQLAMDLQLGSTASNTMTTTGIAGTQTGLVANQGIAGTTSHTTPSTPVAPTTTTPVVNPAPVVAPVPVVTPSQAQSTTPNNDATAQALYDSGINAFNARNYGVALNSFTDFVKVYPSHALVSNAWFWQGESQYQLKNYAAAALAYQQVISSYPNSNKAPASYLKQGMSFIALKKNDAAKERLKELIAIYPKAAEAKRAEQVLSTIK